LRDNEEQRYKDCNDFITFSVLSKVKKEYFSSKIFVVRKKYITFAA
jgi:hypothetical protein